MAPINTNSIPAELMAKYAPIEITNNQKNRLSDFLTSIFLLVRTFIINLLDIKISSIKMPVITYCDLLRTIDVLIK
jgi:hypothetical protein